MYAPFRAFSLTSEDGDHLSALTREGRVYSVQDLPLSSQAALAWVLHDYLSLPVLMITDGQKTLDILHQDLTTWAGDLSDRIAYYPPWEVFPTAENLSSNPDLVGDRLDVLQRCSEANGGPGAPAIIVTSVQALMQKTVPPHVLMRHQYHLEQGAERDMEDLLKFLAESAYEFIPEVEQKGQASHRGGIVDIWPPRENWPVRVEFFGTVVDSMRTFDPETQTSLERVTYLSLLPAREYAPRITTGPAREVSEHMDMKLSGTLLEYLSPQTLWIWSDPDAIRHHAGNYEELVRESDAQNVTITFRTLRERSRRDFQGGHLHVGGRTSQADAHRDIGITPLAGLPATEGHGFQPDLLEEARRDFVGELIRDAEAGYRVELFFDTPGALERFRETFEPQWTGRTPLHLRPGRLSEGFRYDARNLIVVAQSDIYGRRKELRGRYEIRAPAAKPRREVGPRILEWRDLLPGELVVHLDHGVGKYLGLYEIEIDGERQEALTIEYANRARLYLPVAQAHLLSRYIGFGKRDVELHSLGGKRWTREKAAAERSIQDMAASLLETQALRQTQRGHVFAPDAPWQAEFEDAFPYQETEDQHRVIGEVKRDMENARPMDRLVCGDVGYGKTEVAMRAAFKAVMDGKQVAVLVPTTVLAQQHLDTFAARMAAFPIRLEMLSRFRSRAQQHEIVRGLQEGEIDIVIGTHRLIQPDVRFKDLGLVIVDEEQRFGVEHKEKLKQLRRLVDVLTMTATPIPRTLYMGLTGAKDISAIQTPPEERLPVETVVTEYDDELIRTAILREVNRGGQVFFLHNRVHSIEFMRRRLMNLVPEVRIQVAHGQMPERMLEAIMAAFVRGDIDVLLCTTIIESGVDIPNANTIIIDRAERFGLADLYQLRGRVGRYKHKAYAYLLLPKGARIDGTARRRVQALRKYSHLGAGFRLALRDLEIRGAGNILGPEQSGHISAVGFDLYCQLLERTVARMKGEPLPPLVEVEVKLDFIDRSPSRADDVRAAVIPIDYIEDESLRVNAYRKIAALAVEQDAESLQEEFRDRYGPVPESVERLLKIAQLRIVAMYRNIREIEVKEDKVMMKRDGSLLMKDKRFPRLKQSHPTQRLDELIDLVRQWRD